MEAKGMDAVRWSTQMYACVEYVPVMLIDLRSTIYAPRIEFLNTSQPFVRYVIISFLLICITLSLHAQRSARARAQAHKFIARKRHKNSLIIHLCSNIHLCLHIRYTHYTLYNTHRTIMRILYFVSSKRHLYTANSLKLHSSKKFSAIVKCFLDLIKRIVVYCPF